MYHLLILSASSSVYWYSQSASMRNMQTSCLLSVFLCHVESLIDRISLVIGSARCQKADWTLVHKRLCKKLVQLNDFDKNLEVKGKLSRTEYAWIDV